MKFLCLHGMGTSSKILQMQTAALRHELGDGHTYEYVEGTVRCPMAPEIAHLSDPETPHFQYYAANAQSYFSALEQLDHYVSTAGPFDGVLGFSQGAGLALMYLIRHSHLHPHQPLPFKIAILFSRIGVYNPACWRETGKALPLHSMPKGLDRLNIPVAEVWGEKDFEVSKKEAVYTKGIVKEVNIWTFVHSGGHEIPGPSIEGSVGGAVKVIRRAITQAEIGSN